MHWPSSHLQKLTESAEGQKEFCGPPDADSLPPSGAGLSSDLTHRVVLRTIRDDAPNAKAVAPVPGCLVAHELGSAVPRGWPGTDTRPTSDFPPRSPRLRHVLLTPPKTMLPFPRFHCISDTHTRLMVNETLLYSGQPPPVGSHSVF